MATLLEVSRGNCKRLVSSRKKRFVLLLCGIRRGKEKSTI
jgi:hypothetical protein